VSLERSGIGAFAKALSQLAIEPHPRAALGARLGPLDQWSPLAPVGAALGGLGGGNTTGW